MPVDFSSVDAELGPADQTARMCFSKFRFLPARIKEQLQREGLWDDLVQETYLTAWEAWQKGLRNRETYRLMGRRVYAFLKSYGYRIYGYHYYRVEMPLSAIAQDQNLVDKILEGAGDSPSPGFVGWKDSVAEAVLALVRGNGGLSKRQIYTRLQISARELDWHCVPLIRQGLIIEVKRENVRGRPPTPLLVAVQPGQKLPMPEMVKTEREERIRQAYFMEGMSIKQISREFHHTRRTVRKAIRDVAGTGVLG